MAIGHYANIIYAVRAAGKVTVWPIETVFTFHAFAIILEAGVMKTVGTANSSTHIPIISVLAT